MTKSDRRIPFRRSLRKNAERGSQTLDKFSDRLQTITRLCKKNKLRFVAANIPRRYASTVYSKGLEKLDSINADAKRWIVPHPMVYDSTLKCYTDIFKKAEGHRGQNLPKSQAVKDVTMAHFILKN